MLARKPNSDFPSQQQGIFLESVDNDWFSQRLTRTLILVLIAAVIMLTRLIYLQLIQGKEYRRLSEINSIRLQDTDAPRGQIFDRYGRLLVDNRPSFNLNIVLKDARPVDKTLKKLSAYSGLPLKDLESAVRGSKQLSAYKPIVLKDDVGRDTMAAVLVHKYDLPGVEVNFSSARHYPNEETAAHLLGYMGEISPAELSGESYSDCKSGDYIGKFGIEKSLDSYLRGKRGGRQVEVNATGQIVRVLDTVSAHSGESIYLTIDRDLQRTAEALLRGKAAAAVALDPNNGEVLALVSSPTFDPNMFVSGLSREQWHSLLSNPDRVMENKAIQSEYPPASTYKIITAIAGLEEGVIDGQSTFYCPGFYRFGNRVYRCWRKVGHGNINVVQALQQSCDVFFYRVGEGLGVDRLAFYARAAGLGEITKIGLDHESRGLIPTAAWKQKRFGVPWQPGETLSIAIGQGFDLVTPLQMAVLAGAVGTGGTRYQPQLVKKRLSADGTTLFESEPRIAGKIPMKPSTVNLVKEGLRAVVNEPRGTAFRARLKDVPFAGKTGTAQVIALKTGEGSSKTQEQYKDHAWFVAYAPADEPRVAVAVIVEHGEHGASAAAPIAREIIRTYLGLPPDEVSAAIVASSAQAGEEISETAGENEGD